MIGLYKEENSQGCKEVMMVKGCDRHNKRGVVERGEESRYQCSVVGRQDRMAKAVLVCGVLEWVSRVSGRRWIEILYKPDIKSQQDSHAYNDRTFSRHVASYERTRSGILFVQPSPTLSSALPDIFGHGELGTIF